MITELVLGLRERLIANKADIGRIASESKVSRRTLYYVIEGKTLTVETIDRLSKYFERADRKLTSQVPFDSKRNRARRTRARTASNA